VTGFQYLGDRSLEVYLVAQKLFPISRELTVAATLPNAPFGDSILERGDEERRSYSMGSLGLRWVRAGRRNRSRVGLEGGVALIGAYHSGSDRSGVTWGPYASVKFRSRNVVLSFDARWARDSR